MTADALARLVCRLRRARRWSQRELARRAHVALATVQAVEKGRRETRHETIAAIATAFEFDVDVLLAVGDIDTMPLPLTTHLAARVAAATPSTRARQDEPLGSGQVSSGEDYLLARLFRLVQLLRVVSVPAGIAAVDHLLQLLESAAASSSSSSSSSTISSASSSSRRKGVTR